MGKKLLFLAILLNVILVGCLSQEKIYIDRPGQKAELTRVSSQLETFRAKKFGMFIHWGLYSVFAGDYKGNGWAEWIKVEANIPDDEYDKAIDGFTAENFDAKKWIDFAVNAKMQYFVITSKHHDGFAIYPSKVDSYNVSASPYKKDPIKELELACREAGLGFGLYYSIWDWHNPLAKKYLYSKYAKELMMPQLEELVTWYNPDILWFDGYWPFGWTSVLGKKYYDQLKELDSDLLINNRIGRVGSHKRKTTKPIVGDYITPEQFVLESGVAEPWETCMTVGAAWGYSVKDKGWKDPSVILWTLTDVVSKGGNLLLNIGPKADGTFPKEAEEILEGIASWMEYNSEVIFDTTPVELRPSSPRYRMLASKQKPNIYYVVIDQLEDEFVVENFSGNCATVTTLSGKNITFDSDSNGNLRLKLSIDD
ncbi:MAG: alpha-L-fucosidase, partial [Spirochaetales bacterium]|nr:alpha-L-fucosidase [Spirochaetales bacterium]